MTQTFRAERQATARGGYGMNIQLRAMVDSPAVVWIAGNSYVSDGVKVYSINGLGEIRWTVEEWNRDAASNAAVDYFFVSF